MEPLGIVWPPGMVIIGSVIVVPPGMVWTFPFESPPVKASVPTRTPAKSTIAPTMTARVCLDICWTPLVRLCGHVEDEDQPARVLAVVRQVVADVAVEDPLARLGRREGDVVALAGGDLDHVVAVLRRLGHRVPVLGDDAEVGAVQVHRVLELAGADETEEDAVAALHLDRLGRGEALAVKGEVVRERALHLHRRARLARR